MQSAEVLLVESVGAFYFGASTPATANAVTTTVTFQLAPPPIWIAAPAGCTYDYPTGVVTCTDASITLGSGSHFRLHPVVPDTRCPDILGTRTRLD